MVASLRTGNNSISLPTPLSIPIKDVASATIEALSGVTSNESLRSDIIVGLPDGTDSLTPMPKTFEQDFYQVAPPEQTGEGPIRPTLILGFGHTGQRVLQRLTQQFKRTVWQPRPASRR